MSVLLLSPANSPIAGNVIHPLWAESELRALDSSEIKERSALKKVTALQASVSLMADAGRAVTMEILPLLVEHAARIAPAELSILVAVGPRNNGGDGWVIARLLREAGYGVSIFCAAASIYSPEWAVVAQEWVEANGLREVSLIEPRDSAYSREGLPQFLRQTRVLGPSELARCLESCAVFVDALLGIGQIAPPREPIASVLHEARLRQAKSQLPLLLTIAVDVPTGLNADTGVTFTPCLPAHYTCAIHGFKRGCALEPARSACGSVVEVSIIPMATTAECQLVSTIDPHALPARRPDGHKGTYGHVMVIGGSQEMPGAPVLVAHAALRAGAGLVTKVEVPLSTSAALWPEIMRTQLSEGAVFGPEHVSEIQRYPRQPTSYVIGPGLGRHPGTFQFLEDLLALLPKLSPEAAVILDADALAFLAAERTFELCRGATILTPHYGEAARILECESAEVAADPFAAADKLVSLTGACVVLKGPGTIVAHYSRRYLIAAGTPYLATAGSGDVLAGVIGAVLASDGGGSALAYRVAQAVLVHAQAGAAAAARRKGPIIAGDIIDQIGESIGTSVINQYAAPKL